MFLVNNVFSAKTKVGYSFCWVLISKGAVFKAGYEGVLFATSFIPTFSMALAKARPIKNSRERSSPFTDPSQSYEYQNGRLE